METYNENNADIRLLKVLNGEASEKEIELFSLWLEEGENRTYFNQMKELWNLLSGPKISERELQEEERRFLKYIRKRKQQRRQYRLLRWSAVAAVVAISMVVGIISLPADRKEWAVQVPVQASMILPGDSKAILTTASGDQVALAGKEEQYVSIGQEDYVRSVEGRLIYADTLQQQEKLQYNRLSIPRGGEYTLVFSDGTEVILNSNTELTYPVRFGKKERVVSLSGEAFFQVKKDASRPFYVKVGEVTLRVYGTSFNVNTQDKNVIRTALVEGSVGIKGNGREYRMEPSQLAEFSKTGDFKSLHEVDIYPYIAWKEGMFVFEDWSLEDIMETLSLWYNVDVFYASEKIKGYHFTGHMPRYQQIDKILNAISRMVKVNFTITGRTIVVSSL